MFRQSPELKCVTACASAEQALQTLPKHALDVVLLDIHLPGASGIECLPRLKAACPGVQICMLTVFEDVDRVFGALKAGATGYLLKKMGPAQILEAILSELFPRAVNDVIKTAKPPPGIGSQPYRSTLCKEPPQQISAILFADVMRYSELDETKLPDFVSGYLQPLASLIQQARHGGYGPLDYNTWGDGLFCAFDSMLKAGKFALDLQRLTVSGKWKLTGSAEKLKLRVALHAGPVYRIPDPVFPKDTFIGTNLNFAARMEPVTPPGEVSCSQAFAALAAAEGVEDFVCEYFAETQFPKGAGTHPMYLLKTRFRARPKARRTGRTKQV